MRSTQHLNVLHSCSVCLYTLKNARCVQILSNLSTLMIRESKVEVSCSLCAPSTLGLKCLSKSQSLGSLLYPTHILCHPTPEPQDHDTFLYLSVNSPSIPHTCCWNPRTCHHNVGGWGRDQVHDHHTLALPRLLQRACRCGNAVHVRL